jgi:hypothetical protein
MSAVPEEERFAKNVTIMVEAIQESVRRVYNQGIKTIDPSMISLIATIISSFDKNYLIQGFIENSHEKCWEYIRQRDENFFIENAGDIFKYLPSEKVNLFKDLYQAKDANGNNVVSESLKDQIWRLFDAMIKISIKYIHKGRAPYSYSTNEGVVNAYGADFFGEVDISSHAKKWGVVLEYPPKC